MELQWPLILFTTLTAWGCGVLGGAGVLALKGAGKKSQQRHQQVADKRIDDGGERRTDDKTYCHIKHVSS